jgi:uncharacterized protein (TIGR00255 family)
MGLKSMTGHGRGTAEAGGRRVTVELRSVNHRFLELKFRATGLDARVEEAITQAVRKKLERGAVTVVVRQEGGEGTFAKPDLARARVVHQALDELRTSLGITEPVTLTDVISQPGIFGAGEDAVGDGGAEAARAAAEAALADLLTMRAREGKSLGVELSERVERLAKSSDEIARLAAGAPGEKAQLLRDRVSQLLGDDSSRVDAARLATEIALMADRLDITEELVRLRSHLGQLRDRLADDVPVGRRLDFLLQEVGREINTVGSKSQSAEIARLVVEAKADLEKLREQIQNLE